MCTIFQYFQIHRVNEWKLYFCALRTNYPYKISQTYSNVQCRKYATTYTCARYEQTLSHYSTTDSLYCLYSLFLSHPFPQYSTTLVTKEIFLDVFASHATVNNGTCSRVHLNRQSMLGIIWQTLTQNRSSLKFSVWCSKYHSGSEETIVI